VGLSYLFICQPVNYFLLQENNRSEVLIYSPYHTVFIMKTM